MKDNKITLAIDFDGTVVTHDYPKVGKDIGAVSVLQRLSKNKNVNIILWTMRSTVGTNTLNDAVKWFAENNIPLWGINENPTQQTTKWSTSNKQHANIYIDDAAMGAPIKFDKNISDKPFIDWKIVEDYLNKLGLI